MSIIWGIQFLVYCGINLVFFGMLLIILRRTSWWRFCSKSVMIVICSKSFKGPKNNRWQKKKKKLRTIVLRKTKLPWEILGKNKKFQRNRLLLLPFISEKGFPSQNQSWFCDLKKQHLWTLTQADSAFFLSLVAREQWPLEEQGVVGKKKFFFTKKFESQGCFWVTLFFYRTPLRPPGKAFLVTPATK